MTSAAYLDKASGDLRQKPLAAGLDLPFEGYVIFKDYVSGLEYIRSCEELWAKGLYVQLGAYQHHAFLDWRLVEGDQWSEIHLALNGAGVPLMQGRWEEMFVAKEVEEEKPKKPTKKRAMGKKKTEEKKPTKKKSKTKKKAGRV